MNEFFFKKRHESCYCLEKINSKFLKFYFLPLSGLVVDDDNLQADIEACVKGLIAPNADLDFLLLQGVSQDVYDANLEMQMYLNELIPDVPLSNQQEELGEAPDDCPEAAEDENSG